MGLRDIKLPSDTVQVTDDQSFVVRGLGFREITELVETYQPVIAPLFEEMTALRGGGEADVSAFMKTAGFTILKTAPDLVAQMIAIASNDPDPEGVAAANRLPPPVQVDAVERIFLLTFRTEAERKKMVETVIRWITETAGMIPNRNR